MSLRTLDQVNKANPDMLWKIYYYDEFARHFFSTFSNLDGTADDAPTTDVLVILQPMDNGRSVDIVASGDWYCIDEETKWVGMDEDGLQDRLTNGLSLVSLKQGRTISQERLDDIIWLAGNDSDFAANEGRQSQLEDNPDWDGR